jgi:hypothetical protein
MRCLANGTTPPRGRAGHDRNQAREAAPGRREDPEDLVTFTASYLMLDLSALPFHSAEFNADFRLGAGNNGKPLLLLSPAADAAAPSRHERFAVYMELSGDDGTAAGKLGQLVVTRERMIGMVTRGSAGSAKLDDSAGSIYAFAASRDDLRPAEGETNRKGGLTQAIIRSRDGQHPGFTLRITSVVGTLDDRGQLVYRPSLADLLVSLS